MLIYNYFIEIFTIVTLVFICFWIDKYILKRICKKPDEVIIRDIIRDRIVTDRNESELSEEDDYFTQTSEDSSNYSTETDSDEETTTEIRMLKPDYDEETENEYGESLNDNENN